MSTSVKILNCLVFLSAIVAISLDYWGYNELYETFKPLTTVLVILIPMLYGRRAPKMYWSLTVAGLLLCLIGDVFLLDGENFVFGLASFLIAHILFTVSFVSLDKFKRYLKPLGVLLAIGLGYFWVLYPKLGDLALPVFLYFLFIVVMCWQGISLYIWKKELPYKLIAIGVVLFLLSDSILALNKFVVPFQLSGFMILTTYWLAVSLLANATVYVVEQE